MDWILKHKIIAIVIVLTLAGGAWYILLPSSAVPAVLTTTLSASAPAGAQDLVNSLLALRAVSLDGTILTNPSFQALRDFSTPITPEPVGRPNPFAPLGSEASASAISTKSAKVFGPRH